MAVRARFVGNNNIIEASVLQRLGTEVQCRTAIGEFSATVSENDAFEAGDQIDLIIGADLVEVSADSSWTDNCFEAVFVGEEFVGSMVTLYFETGSGNEIKVQKQQREIEALELTHNKHHYLHWKADKTYCLKGSGHQYR